MYRYVILEDNDRNTIGIHCNNAAKTVHLNLLKEYDWHQSTTIYYIELQHTITTAIHIEIEWLGWLNLLRLYYNYNILLFRKALVRGLSSYNYCYIFLLCFWPNDIVRGHAVCCSCSSLGDDCEWAPGEVLAVPLHVDLGLPGLWDVVRNTERVVSVVLHRHKVNGNIGAAHADLQAPRTPSGPAVHLEAPRRF